MRLERAKKSLKRALLILVVAIIGFAATLASIYLDFAKSEDAKQFVVIVGFSFLLLVFLALLASFVLWVIVQAEKNMSYPGRKL